MIGWRAAVWVALAALVAFGTYVRLAPTDPAAWHIDPRPPQPATGVHLARAIWNPEAITATMNSARAFVLVPGTPRDVLERLNKIALASPRTTRLAGSPEEGRMTWVTRSAFWGFPDYTTAQAGVSDVATSDLAIFARSRFGLSDLGVNSTRLQDWLMRVAS